MSVLPFPVIMIVSYTSVSEESHFCSTESSATLKESPPLEETHGPRGLAILSDKKHVNSENSHLSHVGLFTTIILDYIYLTNSFSYFSNQICRFNHLFESDII
jgi:hypothetical protein